MGEAVVTRTHDQRPFVRQLTQTKNVIVDATAIDAGNTGQTHILRDGLMLAHSAATSNYIHYTPGASAGDGDVAACILLNKVDLKNGDPAATAADKTVHVMWIGQAVSDHVLLYDANSKTDLDSGSEFGGRIDFVTE